ncbi:type II toxin-antitoxin system ParD family antitoxin [uncultured Enterovirga sp.]|uniref:ribbon-helix-helix domain-containing protein n=1 Tax=uncultured Enterovirga sp. TaxID=2026352 RepID=UPI0035CB0029
MPLPKTVSLSLPSDVVQAIRSKVATGRYESDGDLVRESLKALDSRDTDLDEWLRTEVIAVYDAHVVDPSRALTATALTDRLQQHFALSRSRRHEA